MAKQLKPVLVSLIYDALLKCYWRKNALKQFLRSSGVSSNYLAQLDQSEKKRAWLDRLFPLLQDQVKGPELLMQMAKALAGMTVFPDLVGWEDTEIKLSDARQAVSALADALGVESESDKAARGQADLRKKSDEKLRTAGRQQSDLNKLKSQMDTLALTLGTQAGGYEFEKWFYSLIEHEDIDFRRPYMTAGRQIDGSITVDGTTYLIELKFEAKQAGADAIDSHKAKVETKADNTMGVVVAMSGYSSVAIQEASKSKSALLLIDFTHIYMVLDGRITVEDLIRRVRRHSSQTGQAYLPASELGG